MRKIPVEQAIGESICHDMTAILADGFKGVRYARGHVIAPEDIPVLLSMGKSHVYVWDPAADEVHEEDAAKAIAQALGGPNIAWQGPSEGKYQATAACEGLFCLHADALRAVNAVPDFTVACRPNYTPVASGERLSGARIVPLVTARANVEAAVQAARASAPVLSVLPFKPLKVGIVITGSEVYTGRIQDRFEPILRKKVEQYGGQVLDVLKAPDDKEAIVRAIRAQLDAGAALVLVSGGMSVDPDDLTPGAIRATGAEVICHGVPVQPGNMLMMAYAGEAMLMGIPGGALHSVTTSVDIFLPRIFAGLRITRADIAGLGEGGLCMGCRECRYPICYFGV